MYNNMVMETYFEHFFFTILLCSRSLSVYRYKEITPSAATVV